MDALSAYFQINVAKEDQQKTTFMLNTDRYYFHKTVIGLSSDTWLKASDEVIEGLDSVFKLVDNLVIRGRNYIQLARRVGALLKWE